jgi:glucuronate isomerase
VLNSNLDWGQYVAPMMFAYNTSFCCSIKTTSSEVTFGIEPKTGKNPNPYLRQHYGEDLGTDIYQRLKICQELARKIVSKNNEESIENSTKYFNSKVKPVTFEESEWVLLKEHNFVTEKLADTFKGPFQIKNS